MTSIEHEKHESLLIQPADLIGRLEANTPMTVVDVRNSKPWDRSDVQICGALRIDPERLPLDPAWPKETLLVFYGTGPDEQNSARAALKAREQGFPQAYALVGGLDAWTELGGPLEKKTSERDGA